MGLKRPNGDTRYAPTDGPQRPSRKTAGGIFENMVGENRPGWHKSGGFEAKRSFTQSVQKGKGK